MTGRADLNRIGVTEKDMLNIMASGKGYEENKEGRELVLQNIDKMERIAEGTREGKQGYVQHLSATPGRWIGEEKIVSSNPIDVFNKTVDELSEQERFVRFGTTDRQKIVDNLLNINKKVDKYSEARSMLESMSEGQLENRYATSDRQAIMQRLGYDKNFLREINQYREPRQETSNPMADARSVGNQALVDQMNNSNFAKNAAEIIKQNPVLQKAVLGEVVYRPGEEGGRPAQASGKQSKQAEAMQIIQQLRAGKSKAGEDTQVLDDSMNKVFGALVEDATYTDKQAELMKDEISSRSSERKLRLLKLLGG